jgi:uncharacterized protein (DUF1800 family)
MRHNTHRERPAPGPSEAFTLHLLRRTTFGITSDLLADVREAGGATAWLDRQLDPESISDTTCTAALAPWPMRANDPPVNHAAMGNGNSLSMEDVVRATLARQLWSERQLFEVMVSFWSDHLNITCPSGEVWATKSSDDVHVVRAHALGTFEDMLAASVTSPAMLLYLNNAESYGQAVNENYGRELLELHTVGRDAGYDHDDVVGAARALSGLSVRNRYNGGTPVNFGTFHYFAERHYVGPVSVLGWSHPNATSTGGVDVARSLITYLARHPSTAERIAAKLAVRFVSDHPPAALVDRLARVYLDHGTAIVPVLRALFGSAEFAASAGAKVSRSAEDLIGAWRALGATPVPGWVNRDGAVAQLRRQLAEMNNAPLGWAAPDGYPDVAAAWAGTGLTLSRWNAHLDAALHRPNNGVLWPDLAAHLLDGRLPSTTGALVDLVLAKLLPGHHVAAAHRDALLAFLGPKPEIAAADLKGLLPVLVALVLDSPYWSVR